MNDLPPSSLAAMRKEISGRLTNLVIQFAAARGLEPSFLWDGLGVDDGLLTDVHAWVSADVFNTMMARLRERTGDPQIMEQVGLAIPRLKAFGFIGAAAFLLKGPGAVTSRMVIELLEVFTKTSTMQVEELPHRRLLLIQRIKPGFPVLKDFCHLTRGAFRALPKTWGLPFADMVEEACQAEGAAACRYRIAWPRLGLRHRIRLWIRGNRLHEKVVRLLTAQNAIIEAKYDEALRASEGLEQAYFRIMASLMQALDAKDPYTQGHSQAVAAYAVEIARAMRRSEAEVDEIRRAALLHDIGKIGVPERILLKDGPLTEEERASVQRHPVTGEKILQPLSFLGPIIQMVAQEHERVDGRGYPRGARGDAIHLGARIISVADALDAITSARPYRRPMTLPEAVAEIRGGAGTQFDPAVVEAFLQALPRIEDLFTQHQDRAR